ncbi:hypothetical protein H9L19_01315 [Weissella diestrammenae]|uniref:Uncharacterized protein n=1 Tax=Weissella diestrammenae TaxID=1162633 RepID=A0A7G9T641_9LACO|nr:hypothetical protein [Weissella diestrammenae]MCM0582404.1 hypothetical protein [Weissella diestrammenae]QNN75566.1 hypothetical protein H9L19_01315 [Weissella diestrammenae]
MREFKKISNWRFWIWMPILAWGVPLLFNSLPSGFKQYKLVLSLFLINMIFSIFVGIYLRKHGSFWMLLPVWPIIFAIGVIFGLNALSYGFFLALTYLIIELFAYTSGQEEEVDVEQQIPIDGGIKEVK